jgi:serine/alanine adding enzyme
VKGAGNEAFDAAVTVLDNRRGYQSHMTQFEIVELGQSRREEEWQAYVTSVPHASLYHTLQWRDIILRTFGHRSWYLMVRSHGETRGVLPLIEIQSLAFGHFFVSLPFLDYGGILADTPEYEAALAAAAADLALVRGARHVELRQSFAAAGLTESGWKLRQHKAALVIPLKAAPAAHWSNLSSRLRGKVRKAEKSGATFSVGRAEALDDFYHVFAVNMRDLGTPVYSRTLFQNVIRFDNNATVLLVRRAGQAVAGAIALRRKESVELPWICSDYAQAGFNVNEFLYWNIIKWACQSGAREVNLGRCSIDSGTYRFKIQWNPEARPLYWYYWLGSGVELPEFSPNHPKYALAIHCWQKMPVSLANRVGPWIVRNIP